MDDFFNESLTDSTELLSDYSDEPSEYNPFCNNTEVVSFNENYSKVVPTFFFRTQQSSLHPSRFEKAELKHFYNITGVLLLIRLMLEIILCLVFNLSLFFITVIPDASRQSFKALISNSSVRCGFLIITTTVITFFIFRFGCKYSDLTVSSVFHSSNGAKTADIIAFFMSGLFISSIGSASVLLAEYFMPSLLPVNVTFTSNIPRLILIVILTCFVEPVSEGLIFRGIVIKNMSRASQRFGIISTSLLCALSSGYVIKFIPCFLMSVLLSKLTIKYCSVLPSIIIHVTLNISNTIITAYGDLFYHSDPAITKIWIGITFIVGGFFAIYILLKEPLPNAVDSQRKRCLPVAARSPFIILVIIFYIVTSFNFFSY